MDLALSASSAAFHVSSSALPAASDWSVLFLPALEDDAPATAGKNKSTHGQIAARRNLKTNAGPGTYAAVPQPFRHLGPGSLAPPETESVHFPALSLYETIEPTPLR